MKTFLDSMDSGAWPFLVGGVICQVNSVNERDLSLLISLANVFLFFCRLIDGKPAAAYGPPCTFSNVLVWSVVCYWFKECWYGLEIFCLSSSLMWGCRNKSSPFSFSL